MPVLLGGASDERLRGVLAQTRRAAYSYAEVGASRGRVFPAGYHEDHYAIDLGTGAGVFERAVEGLRRWAPQRGAGARILPEDAPLEVGQTVLSVLSLPLVTMVAPCRVVYVTDESARFGFAYGTLEGHPEQGEEAFYVVRNGDDVRFEIAAFSRAGDVLVRLGEPIARILQRRTTNAYLTGLKRFVDDPGS